MATKKQPREKFGPFDPADSLKSTENMVAYLEASMEEAGDDSACRGCARQHRLRARNGPPSQGHRRYARGSL